MNPPIQYSEWCASAKIDYITIALPSSINCIEEAVRFIEGCRARVEWPKTWGRWGKHACAWVTVHDPSYASLQYLIDAHPDAEILDFEIAVDLRLRCGTNDQVKLEQAHQWLRHSLLPQKHTEMRRVSRRKVYDRQDGKIKPDNSRQIFSHGTVYWQNPTGYQQIRCYTKTLDNGKPIARHSVRVETTLNRGGCQLAGVSHLRAIPSFADGMRRYLSPFFHVAAGIKVNAKRVRSEDKVKMLCNAKKTLTEQAKAQRRWQRFGALSAVRSGCRTISDRDANRLIGAALNELRREILKLKLPEKRGNSM
jgi:hypothetical protein